MAIEGGLLFSLICKIYVLLNGNNFLKLIDMNVS